MNKLIFPGVGGWRTARRWTASIAAMVVLAICGCSDTPKPFLSAITETNAKGVALATPVTALSSSNQLPNTVSLVGVVTNDAEGLGVDWTATCTSTTPGVGLVDDSTCGSFSVAHTASGPVPSYTTTTVYVTTYTAPSSIPKGATVTLTADATSLPSSASSITLTIQ